MADELKNALDQLKTDIDSISNTNRVQLGPILDALPDTTQVEAVVAITLVKGMPHHDTYTATTDLHMVQMRWHWLLTPINVEVVEQNMASQWDLMMVKFHGADADRNLSEKATLFLLGDEEGTQGYECGYEDLGGKLHRVMVVMGQLILDTHSV